MSSPDLRVHPQKTSTTEADVPVGAEFAAHPIGSYITAEGQLLRTTGGRFTGEMCAGFLSLRKPPETCYFCTSAVYRVADGKK